MSLLTSTNSIFSQITIRPVIKTDEPQIWDLFYADVYRWTRWVQPILFNGILSLFKIPICVWISISIGIGLVYDVSLASWHAWALALLLLVLFLAKLLSFLSYLYFIPEFKNRNLTELYSQDGFAFFVAKLDDGKIAGCVGVQKVNEMVH